MSSIHSTVYVVSGANRGIGFGLVEAFASRPNSVVFAGVRNLSKVERLKVLSSQVPGQVHIIELSSGGVEDNKAAAEVIERVAGHIDVVIANAGICNYFGTADNTPLAQMDEHFQINTVGPLVLFQATAALLKKSISAPKFVVISTSAGSIGFQDSFRAPVTAYGASKAAVNFITRKIHFENEHLISFPLSPGWVQTDQGNAGAKANGMEQAPMTLADSVKGIVKLVDEATRDTHGGKFFGVEGEEIPW